MNMKDFLSDVWLSYFEGKASIEDVLHAYDKHRFDANQDLPGNMLWEELYKASPKGTKVILTVRASDKGKNHRTARALFRPSLMIHDQRVV